MGDWQEIVALGIVALTASVLTFNMVRRWWGTEKTVTGCGGCRGCGGQKNAPDVSSSVNQKSSTVYPLFKLKVNPLYKDKPTQ